MTDIINEINRDELINFKYVIDLIKEEFEAVWATDPDFYSKFNFEISNEQFFVPDEDRAPNKIYMVIKFSPAQIDFGQNVMPLTIQAISESNGIKAAQRTLLEFAQFFNQQVLVRDKNIIYQNFTAPNTISHFEVVYEGFRSVLIMAGTVLISSNINRTTLRYFDGDYAYLDIVDTKDLEPNTYFSNFDDENCPEFAFYNGNVYEYIGNKTYVLKSLNNRLFANVGLHDERVALDMFSIEDNDNVYVWGENGYEIGEGEKIDILHFTDNFDASPDTQPYFKTKNFTESIVKFGSYSFNIVSFLTDNALNNKVLKIIARKKNVNNNFYFKLYFDNGINMPLLKYKMARATKQQNKGEMPSFAIAFIN